MKAGVRILGVAESFVDESELSTVAGVVTRANRVVDGFSFGTCTVGGLDATETIIECYESLDREDVQYVLVAGIAPAWFNVVDLERIHEATDRPTLSVTYEESEGLEPAFREHFSGEPLEKHLAIYRSQPDRQPITVNNQDLFVRVVGTDLETAGALLRTATPEGGRPEPVRVARMAARAVDRFRRT